MFANKSPNSKFSCSSFKDIHLLLSDDNNNSNSSNNNSSKNKSGSIFHRVKLVNSLLRSWSTRPPTLPNCQSKVVIFYTSLRVVRSTSEDCRTVRSILRSFPVPIDERDVSMDHSYTSHLHRLFPPNPKPRPSLPLVFIAGKFVGGADEVRAMHESGELKAMLSALPVVRGGTCEACGGFRFVLCEDCSGSRKCYSEKSGGFRTCGVCNENGLVRCPSCSSCP